MPAYWAPQPGQQLKGATCPADVTMFGGSRGGGKSDALLGRHLRGVEVYGRAWNGFITRRKYKEFNELRRRIDDIIAQGLPAQRIGGDQQINQIRFDNGGQVTLAAISTLKMVEDWIGHQFTEISVDEATTFPFFTKMIDKLKGSLRSPQGVPCHIFCTGNPGGPGHNEVKNFFRLGRGGASPEQIFYELADPDDEKSPLESRVFVPSFLSDNRILCENDPKYVNTLLSIRDPALRAAWLRGDWDVFIGQAFGFNPDYHIVAPMPVPPYIDLYMTFDWGWGKPFSVGWWYFDSDGRAYRFSEWYGWNNIPNDGLRMEDSKIAEGIKEREAKLGIEKRTIVRISGPDCFSKKPDYKGGGQGPSTAEVFAGHGLMLKPGDPDRVKKIRQVRERFIIPDRGRPMLVIYKGACKQFERTIPALTMDEDKPEDIDTEQEDHIYDEVALMCMHRPLKLAEDYIEGRLLIEDKTRVRSQLETQHQKAWSELDDLRKRQKEIEEAGEDEYFYAT